MGFGSFERILADKTWKCYICVVNVNFGLF